MATNIHSTHVDYSLDIVVSVFNEEESIEAFFAALASTIATLDGYRARVIFVDDGSSDSSPTILDSFGKRPGVTVIHFSRNFGHEAAMLAGVDFSTADYLVCMDADLQHPPSAIPKALALLAAGSDIVLMKRTSNQASPALRSMLNQAFYQLLGRISTLHFEENASDFFFLRKPVVKVLQNEYRERTRFLRGFIQAVGFVRTTLPFEAPNRFAGTSKYSFARLFNLAKSAIFSFSTTPLRISFAAALALALFSVGLVGYSFVRWFFGSPPSGYTTLVVLLAGSMAALFFFLGVQGEYIAQLIEEVKKRPTYVVARIAGEAINPDNQ